MKTLEKLNPRNREKLIRHIEAEVKANFQSYDWEHFKGYRAGLKALAQKLGAQWSIKNDGTSQTGKGSHKGLSIADDLGNAYKMTYPDHAKPLGKGLVARLVRETAQALQLISVNNLNQPREAASSRNTPN